MRTGKQSCVILLITLAFFLAADFLLSTRNPLQQLRVDLAKNEGAVLRTRHPLYHHDLAPDVDITTVWGTLRYRACTDANGFKGACDPLPRDAARRFDVAFIGDSFTEGVGYAFEETAVGRFAAAHPELSVVNLGVASYSPSIYLRKIRYLLDKGFSFGRVIVLPDMSDIDDECTYYALRDGRVIGKKDPDCALYYTEIVRYFKYTTRIFRPLLQRLFPHEDPDAGRYGGLGRANWPYLPRNEAVERGIDRATAAMRELKNLLDSRGIPMSVVVYPWPEQLRRGDARHRGVTLWEEFCAREKCRAFTDAGAALFAEAEQNGAEAAIARYYIPGDAHFNAEGNRLLFEALEKAGL